MRSRRASAARRCGRDSTRGPEHDRPRTFRLPPSLFSALSEADDSFAARLSQQKSTILFSSPTPAGRHFQERERRIDLTLEDLGRATQSRPAPGMRRLAQAGRAARRQPAPSPYRALRPIAVRSSSDLSRPSLPEQAPQVRRPVGLGDDGAVEPDAVWTGDAGRERQQQFAKPLSGRQRPCWRSDDLWRAHRLDQRLLRSRRAFWRSEQELLPFFPPSARGRTDLLSHLRLRTQSLRRPNQALKHKAITSSGVPPVLLQVHIDKYFSCHVHDRDILIVEYRRSSPVKSAIVARSFAEIHELT